MSDVQETLQQLVIRRLREMGEEHGRSEPLTLAEAFRAVDKPEVTYELVRRVEKDGHSRIGDKAVRTIAAMLRVDENEVRAAARQRPALGRFELPSRADKLEGPERSVVLSVIDAILDAAEGRREPGSDSPIPHVDLPPGGVPKASEEERAQVLEGLTSPETRRRGEEIAEGLRRKRGRGTGKPDGGE